ncbi:MAG: aspartyl protease family protein [Rhodanobacteraceae bacterium]
MFKRFCRGVTILALLVAVSAHAEDASDVFARYKAASGGAKWDAVKTLHASGTLAAGGLNGDISLIQDLSTGRSSDAYKLGPIEGADGYDGQRGWTRDPGGEVAALDAPEALRRARSQAWLDARGYWYPDRIGATYGAVSDREADGKHYRVVEARPEGGDPIVLWFDAGTSELARIQQRDGQDTSTTMLGDVRDSGGVRLPFQMITDRTDAAGRTDPRARTEVKLAEVKWNEPITDADFAMPEMVATAHIDDASGTTRIAFDLVNNHIYADGSIDGKKARFLVDTGGANVLTPAAAKKFGLAGEGKLAGRGVGDSMVDVSFANAKEVRLGGAVLAKPVFAIIDLGELPKVEGVECDGLVGYEMFRRFGVTIDYAGRTLTLAEPAKFAPPTGSTAVPFDLDDRIPIVAGTLDGVPVRISIDTGSRASLTMHSPFVREHDLVVKYHAAPEAVVGWGVGGPSRGRPARLGTLKLGDQAVVGSAGDFYMGDKGSFANPDLGANMGGGVLRRFTVAFDYTARRMYLAPNADFAKPDAFDRSGLFLLGDGDAFKVVDVAPDSAALRAGMKNDDRINAIGGEKVATRSLAEWRARLRELPVGTRLKVDVQRGGKPLSVELLLADRIPSAF